MTAGIHPCADAGVREGKHEQGLCNQQGAEGMHT
jgi:hypothetical protein